MEHKKMESFIGAKDYTTNLDVDVFKEEQVCFFVKVDNDLPFLYEAHRRDVNDSIDYTLYSKTREGDYKILDGGVIYLEKKPELQVVKLLSLSGFSQMRKVNPEDIFYVEPEEMEEHMTKEVFRCG